MRCEHGTPDDGRDFWRGNLDSMRVVVCCALLAGLLSSCVGDVDRISPGEGRGGYQRNSDGGVHRGCVDQPWAVVFGFSLDANGLLSHARTDYLPASRVRLTQSVSSVAQGVPGSENLLAVSLLSAGDNVLAQDLFNDPRSADADARMEHGGGLVELALQLVPDTNRLEIANWNTGVVLLDLDLHGDLQLLCLDWPCLDLCASPDAGAATASDGSADLTVAVDESGAG